MIKLIYSSVDGVRRRYEFKTLAAAQKRAWYFVGEFPEIGTRYAISGDGIGKIVVEGATLAELFPVNQEVA